MKINRTTTQLAFFFTLLHLITRGVNTALQIIDKPVQPTVLYLLQFLAEISFIVVIVYLISVLKALKAKAAFTGMIVYLVLAVFSFALSVAVQTSLIVPTALLSILLNVQTVLLFITLIFLLAVSFRIDPPAIGSNYRTFFILVIILPLLKSAVSLILLKQWPGHVSQGLNYFDILSLLPPVIWLLIIQQVSVLINNKGTLNKNI
ncbi:hypothetical protein EOD41_01630 [Mucilaginibacter limnophilus]|uniref:Uncharacterized protein n=1 Tax=Mucilaginibacter limnophilus TaxID=1932778 RepID=A0A437MYJ0_9SPHI|nr:hypothetical protein [Mucilaginibacter limnophilus]RVU02666.1 hypothetical protein EOD41_01630 [Mucilaginibacter limnophilus]